MPIYRVNAIDRRLKGGKYFVSGHSGGRILTLFIDTGADISLMPRRFIPGLETQKLDSPFKVTGFQGEKTVVVTEKALVPISFRPGLLQAEFYVVDAPHPIIGTDLLRDHSYKVSLITGRNCFRVGNETLITKSSPAASRDEYLRRKSMGQFYRNTVRKFTHGSTAWMRSCKKVVLPPRSLTKVSCFIENEPQREVTEEFSMMSRFLHDRGQIYWDEDEEETEGIWVPCVTFEEKNSNHQYLIPVENRSDEEFVLSKDFVFGDIVNHPSDDDREDFQIYPITEILAEYQEREERKANVSDIRTCDCGINFCSCDVDEDDPSLPPPMKDTPPAGSDLWGNKIQEPVLFSEILGKNKVDHEVLERCHESGVEMDVDLPQPPPEVEVELLDDIDIEAERAKSLISPYWKDKDEFLSQFNLKSLDAALVPRVQKLLWDFKHVFHDEREPTQFHKGMKTKPIVINRVPGKTPRKEKVRVMSDKKLKYLRDHITSLVAQGVLEELQDVHDCHASPAHVVLEERFVASKNATVFKTRFTADMREINKCLPESSYPLPNMDQFRQNCAKKGYKVFSNFDCSAFFYQMVVDKDSARRNFGVYALNKIFVFLRLAMGCRSSPSIAQSIIERCFRCHDRAHPFLDDVTVVSTDVDEHIEKDLPKMLALASYFNILLKPSKADIIRDDCRILGHQVSEEAMTLSAEKIKKINELQMPVDKKSLISSLAFMMYFNKLAPRLSELTAPLRRLAVSKVRFKPEKEHFEAFEAAKKHLLDERVNAIRMPSQDPADLIVLWTDASARSISCLVTQMLHPLGSKDGRKALHIVGAFSSVIKPAWENFPIWILELIAFYEATRKFSFLLCGRNFFVATDSKVVSSWCSLELVPRDLARRILHLQRFNYRIIFIESRINPADSLSRLDPGPAPEGEFPRFLRQRIFNSKGVAIPWQDLFSQRKSDEARDFFLRSRNQPLSRAVDELPAEEIVEEDDENDILFAADHSLEISESASPPKRLEFEEAEDVYESIAALDFNDEELQTRGDEEEEDEEEEEGVDCVLPIFSGRRLEEVKSLQEADGVGEKIKRYLDGSTPNPSKYEALLLPEEERHFLRHKSLFRVSSQDLIFRLWVFKDGVVTPLIYVSAGRFEDLIAEAHAFKPGGNNIVSHFGQRKTMTMLERKYFAFGMRRKIKNFISLCAECRLNSHPVTSSETTGSHLRTEPNACMTLDYWGPIGSFATSSTGRPRYVLVAVDQFSRYVITSVTNSVDDAETLKALFHIRSHLNGFPSSLQMDNAIITSNSKCRAFLDSLGVEIRHGAPTVSRCQSHAERTIGTLTRLVTKFHTSSPSCPFEKLVCEATICINNSPADGLPDGRAPKDVHFCRPTSNFLRTAADEEIRGPKRVVDAIKAARIAERETLRFNVSSFLKRSKHASPTNYNRRLKVGDFALRKQTVFPTGSSRKLCFKIRTDGYEITHRVATNLFRCVSVMDGHTELLAGDVLVRVKDFSRERLIQLIRSMEAANERNTSSAGRRTTRRTNIRTANASPLFVSLGECKERFVFPDLADTNLFA